MRGWLAAIVLSAGLATAAAPAYAADEKTIDCVTEQLDAPTLVRVEGFFEQAILAPSMDTVPIMPDADERAVQSAADRCARLHGWNGAAAIAAQTYARSKRARVGAERGLRSFGIDPAPIAAFYDRQPLSLREVEMSDEAWRPTLMGFLEEARTHHLFDLAEARRIGFYLACLSLIDVARAEFRRA